MTAWNTTEICACGAKGDLIDSPLYTGECDHCEAEMCSKCGEVEGDVDGNSYACRACYDHCQREDAEGILLDEGCGHDDCPIC